MTSVLNDSTNSSQLPFPNLNILTENQNNSHQSDNSKRLSSITQPNTKISFESHENIIKSMNSSSTIEMPKSKFEPTVWPKMQKILKISNRGKKKKKNWVLLRNIFRGIFTITHTETKKIHNEAEFIFNIKNEILSPILRIPLPIIFEQKIKMGIQDKDKKKQEKVLDQTEEAIHEIKNNEKFYKMIEEGDIANKDAIIAFIDNDPMKYIFDDDEPGRRINCKNLKGETPLYLSCKNGHLEMTKLLLSLKANPHILSDIGTDKKNDSILSAAARWNHQSLLNYLLETIKWKEEEIEFAMKNFMSRQSKKCKQMLQKKLQTKHAFFYKLFPCCKGLFF